MKNLKYLVRLKVKYLKYFIEKYFYYDVVLKSDHLSNLFKISLFIVSSKWNFETKTDKKLGFNVALFFNKKIEISLKNTNKNVLIYLYIIINF